MRGELKKASDLFAKYQKTLIAPEATVVKAVVEVIDDLFSVQVETSKIRYSPTTKILFLGGVGPLQSEIKLREKEVLDHLRGRIGPRNSPKRVV